MNLLERIGYTPEKFREAVVNFRKEGGLTREQFSAYLGCVSLATIYRWETGKATPRNKAVVSRLILMRVISGTL